MSEAASTNYQMRWETTEVKGLEHLTLTISEAGIYARSVVIGGDNEEETVWALTYTLECDRDWNVRRVAVEEVTTGQRLRLISDGRGNWTDETDRPLLELAGCMDVDIRATPFTNTLPLRRLQFEPGQAATIQVVFVTVPTLTATAVLQRYTALAPNKWLFEALDSGFQAELTTDDDGFVVNYPNLFRRVAVI